MCFKIYVASQQSYWNFIYILFYLNIWCVVKETLFCIFILEMELWCLQFTLIQVNLGFMSCHFIWLLSINFSSIYNYCMLGLTMLVRNNPLANCSHRCFFNNFVDKLKLNTVTNKNIWFVRVTVYPLLHRMIFR